MYDEDDSNIAEKLFEVLWKLKVLTIRQYSELPYYVNYFSEGI